MPHAIAHPLRWSARLATCTLAGALALIAANPAAAQRVRVPTAERLDSIVRAHWDAMGLVGLSVGVMHEGHVLLAKGYGLASIERQQAVTSETRFPIGSVTKQFTCSVALLLEQDGRLRMQDRVATYLPALTRAGDVTLLDLGQMVAGYRDYYPLDYVTREMQADATAEEIMRAYATRPLDFAPGTRWSYSNTNFTILGAIAEQVSGQPLGALMQQRLFTPLGMRHTTFDAPPASLAQAVGYRRWALGAPTPAQPEGKGWTGAAGAIWSTPTDLLAWDLALVTGKVLGPAAYRTLTTPRQLIDGRNTEYGCGIGVRATGPVVVLTHGGAVSGSVTSNAIIPSSRSAVVLLANSEVGLGRLSQALLQTLLPQTDLPTVAGPTAQEAVRDYLTQLAAGRVDRTTLSDEWNAHLTPAREAEAAATLQRLGAISAITIVNRAERGGMEVAAFTMKVGVVTANGTMYRTPDGKIQQVLFTAQ